MPTTRPPADSPPSQGQRLPAPPPSQGQSLPAPPSSQGQHLPAPPPDLQLPAGTEDVVPQNPSRPPTPTPTPTPTTTTAPIRRSPKLLLAAIEAVEVDTYNLKLLAWTAVSLADAAEAERQLTQAHAEEQAGGSSSRPKSAGDKMKLLSSSSSSSPSLPLALATNGKNHASSISMAVPQPPPPKKLIPSAAVDSASSLSMAVPMPPPPENLPSAAAQAASSLSMAVPLPPSKKLPLSNKAKADSSLSMTVPLPPPKKLPSATSKAASSISMAVPMPPPPKLPSSAAQAASSLSMAGPLPPPKKLSSMAAPVASSAAGASASVLQPGDKKELELGEIPPEKPLTADCKAADSARKLLLGKGKEPADRGETSTGSSAHVQAPAVEITETDQKKMREVFVGGLHRDVREDDVRAALSVAGEITEVRIIMEENMLQNRGYCFVTYREAAMATRALTDFANVEICGKPCRVAVPEGNEISRTAQGDPSEDSTRIYREDSTYAIPVPSYAVPPLAISSYYPMYHNGSIVNLPDPNYGPGEPWGSGSQMRQPGSHRQG